jgi:glycine betaine/proline transport system substrate-binding protein
MNGKPSREGKKMPPDSRAGSVRTTFNRREFLGLGAAGALLLGGCGNGSVSFTSNERTTLGSIGWSENVAVSTLSMLAMREFLGHGNVNTREPLDLGPLFLGVADGGLMAFQDVWLPDNTDYLNSSGVKGKVELLPPWYQGPTKYGIAVPAYMKGIDSIADLPKTGLRQITGIESSASINPQISYTVIPKYHLKGWELFTSSTKQMLDQLQEKYRAREPIAFLAWSPNWMNAEYDIRYLKDPKNALGKFTRPSTLHILVNKNLREKDPRIYAFLKALKLDREQVISIEQAINVYGANHPERGVKAWLENHRDVVKPWVEAAGKAVER